MPSSCRSLGTSTRNQRIESFWLHVNQRVTLPYKDFFLDMSTLYPDWFQGEHGVRYVVAHLFLGRLNADCDRFVALWNNHPMSSRGGRTPLQILHADRHLRGNVPVQCEDDYGLYDDDGNAYADGGQGLPQLDVPPLPCPFTPPQLATFEAHVRPLTLEDTRSTWHDHVIYGVRCMTWVLNNVPP